MSFINMYFKKVAQSTEWIINKTKSLSRKSKLKDLIDIEEEMIRSYYMQIGQVYLHKHGNDPEDCYLPFIRGIQESNQKIEDIKNNL